MDKVSVEWVRIMGVDPGSLKAGWGLVDVHPATREIRHVDNGVFFFEAKAELSVRLVDLARSMDRIVSEYKPDISVVEDVFVQKGARSALILGQARGAVLATLGMRGLRVASHMAVEVKAAVAGTGRADKDQVAAMVSAYFKLPETPFEDAADALALALCHGMKLLATGKFAQISADQDSQDQTTETASAKTAKPKIQKPRKSTKPQNSQKDDENVINTKPIQTEISNPNALLEALAEKSKAAKGRNKTSRDAWRALAEKQGKM